jgi:hypothetical protein
MTLISPEYLELQKSLHQDHRYGTSSGQRVNDVLVLKEREGCETVLDYGCGKGHLRQRVGECVAEYDPAIPGKDADPEPADLVVCSDVLEHIEPDNLNDVLLHIRSKTKKRFYFVVNLRQAQKSLPDGRNAHLIIESSEWWREQIEQYFWITEFAENDYEMTGVAQPVTIVGAVKSVGVMRDERIAHVRQNVIKTPRRIPDAQLKPHEGLAIIACYGPSLKDTYPLLKKQHKKFAGTLVSVSGAHDYLRQKGITPDIHVECDPRPHKSKMLKKRSRDTKYYMASCCAPEVIDMLKGHDVTLWHLYNGPESFEIRDIKSEEFAAMIPGGGSVGLRTITLLYFLGFRKFIVHGMDCSFEGDEQHAGAHSGKVQKTIKVRPAVTINNKPIRSDKEYVTSPVLISYANHMLKDLRVGKYPGCEFYWYGRGLFQEMLQLQNLQLQAEASDQQARGIEPEFLEPKDYFSPVVEEAA